jgi:hypothetical protein
MPNYIQSDIALLALKANSSSYALTASFALNGGGGGSGTPGGSDTEVQFNDAGTFSGSSYFTFDKNNNVVSITGSTILSGSTRLFGLDNPSAPQVLTYDPSNGRIYYTASSAFGGAGSGPGGANTDIQFNDAGNFSGSRNFRFDGTNKVYLTGSISASSGTNTIGFFGTSSWSISSSRATTSSFSISSSVSRTASYLPVDTYEITASWAQNASQALTANSSTTSTNADTASLISITDDGASAGSYEIVWVKNISSGEILYADNNTFYYNPATQTVTVQNLAGTASWAKSASYLPEGTYQITSSWAESASQAINSQTASYLPIGTYQITASWAQSASQGISSSYALTASHALNAGGGGDFVPSSWTGSYNTGSFSGSFIGTSSWAQSASNAINAQTASFLPVGTYQITSSWAESASQAISSSFALVAATANNVPITVITASTGISGDYIYSLVPRAAGGVDNNVVGNSVFLGLDAGTSASVAGVSGASNSVFIGYTAGLSASSAAASVFLGLGAGSGSAKAISSNFIGNLAGVNAPEAFASTFIGELAGNSAISASNSTFIGPKAGIRAVSASFSILLGQRAGESNSTTQESIGKNNIIIGNNISLPYNTQHYANIGGALFISGTYSNTSSNAIAALFSESISSSRVGINKWNPSYSLDVSGSVAFANLTDTAQTHVVTIDTSSGQLFFTASSAIGGGSGTGFPFSGSAVITGSLLISQSGIIVTGSIDVTGSISASFGSNTVGFFGTSSWAESASQALTASFVSGAFLQGGNSFGETALLGTNDTQDLAFETSGSIRMTISSSGVVGIGSSSVFNQTASLHVAGFTLLGGPVAGFSNFNTTPVQVSGSLGIRGSLFLYNAGTNATSSMTWGNAGSAGWVTRNEGNTVFRFITGSTILYHLSNSGLGILKNTNNAALDIDGSTIVSGSLTVSSSVFLPNITTVSQLNIITVDTASGQLYYTASSAIGGGAGFPFSGDAVITGSLLVSQSGITVTGSIDVTGSISASFGSNTVGFFGTSSWTQTASYATNLVYSTSSIIGNGLSSSFNINHGFGTRNLHITVYESESNGETVYPDIRRINENTASIIFANPPSASQYVVYISI